jgi:hypothetical protein
MYGITRFFVPRMGHVHLTMAKEEKQVPLDIVESYLDQEP